MSPHGEDFFHKYPSRISSKPLQPRDHSVPRQLEISSCRKEDCKAREANKVLYFESNLQIESPVLPCTKTSRFQSHDKSIGAPDHGEKDRHEKRKIFPHTLDYVSGIEVKPPASLSLSHGVRTCHNHGYHTKGR